ncbi:MAG: protease SohB [Oceanococcaceae bacterium]
MDYLFQYGLFLAKAATLVVALIFIVASVGQMVRQAREHMAEQLDVRNINQRLERMADIVRGEVLNDAAWKEYIKAKKKEQKEEDKAARKGKTQRKPHLFVLDFDGDIAATATGSLREEITAILQIAEDDDAVLLRLESSGGYVHSYGLAASQLQRLRARKLHLTVAVDKVAASGGYLMAGVADRIIAAPFAIIGSIGVVAQLPNVHRLLKKNDVDIELHTAGQYKRTLTMLGENTDEGRAKFVEELEDTHALFKEYLAEHRSGLDLARVATGEHWYGRRALELKLIDEISTSDDYLLTNLRSHDIYSVSYKQRRPLSERLSESMRALVRAVVRWRPALATSDIGSPRIQARGDTPHARFQSEL